MTGSTMTADTARSRSPAIARPAKVYSSNNEIVEIPDDVGAIATSPAANLTPPSDTKPVATATT